MNSRTGKLSGEAYGWYVVFVLCVCGVVAFIDRLVANLLGQAGGPWLVAQLTDGLFGNDAAVGWSLMIAVPLLLAAGSLLTWTGWRPLRAQFEANPA